MTDQVSGAAALFLSLDALRSAVSPRLHVVTLWPNSHAHIYAFDSQDARRRVLEINKDAKIVSVEERREII